MTLTTDIRIRGRVAEGARDLIGSTPLVRLSRMFADRPFEVFGKLEKANPCGSIKDRAAASMIDSAIADGILLPGVSVVVESSSGNLGIALAQLCSQYNLGFICVTDVKATRINVAMMRALGATVEVISEPDPATGQYLPARIARVGQLLHSVPHSWWPNQYANLNNPAAHADTMREVLDALAKVDVLVCTTGSCGTLRGASEYLKTHSPATRIVAVDALGSVIFPQGGAPRQRMVPGHGAAVRPPLMTSGLADALVLVSDKDCVCGCRAALHSESLLLGGSSGAALTAVHRIAARIPSDSVVVVILPDGGERYLDTIYDEQWVAGHIGDIPPKDEWENPSGQQEHIHYLTEGALA